MIFFLYFCLNNIKATKFLFIYLFWKPNDVDNIVIHKE